MPSYDGDSIIIMLDITLKHEQIDSEKKMQRNFAWEDW